MRNFSSKNATFSSRIFYHFLACLRLKFFKIFDRLIFNLWTILKAFLHIFAHGGTIYKGIIKNLFSNSIYDWAKTRWLCGLMGVKIH